MPEFPALTHIAVTVRDLTVGTPWYRALFGTDPALDEDTDAGFHHAVWVLGSGTLFGIHQHTTAAPEEAFSARGVGAVGRTTDRAGCGARRHRGRRLRIRIELP